MSVFKVVKLPHRKADPASAGRFANRVTRFGREEEGSLIIFGLFAFVMMLLLSGIALDLMRFEERRTTLQNTIDRAALAAADLNQTLDPKDVVIDYFTKAGLVPPKREDINVSEGAVGDSRTVEIKVAESMDTWFMQLVGVNELSTPAVSAATESVGQIEISLVLDVSGSMGSNNRLVNLKPAAKAFVDQIFDAGETDKVSISIIPYATQVAVSEDFASYFKLTGEQTDSACFEFTSADFNSTTMSLDKSAAGRTYQRNGHFDPFYKSTPPTLFNCPPETSRRVLPFSGNRSTLKNYIDGLFAAGNTSIDIGMKWGAALLDPSLQPVVDGMIAANQLPDAFSERPYAYDDTESLKIIVVMTDGANTTEYRLKNNTASNPYYDEGVSLLVRNPAYRTNGSNNDDYDIAQYSLWDATKKQYWVYALGKWRTEPWGSGQYDKQVCSGSGKYKTCWYEKTDDYGDDPVPMTWQEVWKTMSLYYFSDNIIAPAYGSTVRDKWRPSNSNATNSSYIYSTKDAITTNACNAAKAKGIRIYTIAFEAPPEGQSLLEACQNSGYYAVEGLDIQEAFAGIANSINKLRLTH